jgi:hypothetical protein
MPELDKGDGLSRRNQRKVVVEAATASSNLPDVLSNSAIGFGRFVDC